MQRTNHVRIRSSQSRLARLAVILVLLLWYTSSGFAAGGTLDTTFGTSGSGIVYTDIDAGSSDEIHALALYDSGRIVAAGSSDTGIALTRYTVAGAIDTTFSNDGITTLSIGGVMDVAHAAIIQENNRIIIAGATNNGTNDHIFVARYSRNGSLDSNFGTGGVVTTSVTVGGDDVAHALTLQTDRKILVAGEINGDFALLRYDDAGALDPTFGGGDGIATSDFSGSPDQAFAIALQPDGKILLAGETDNGESNDFALARFNTDGSLDTTFGTGGLVNTDFGGQTNEFALSLALQDDGKIVLGGYRSDADDDFALARYDTDGSLDATFGANGLVTSHLTANDDQAYGVSIQATGRIVLAGTTNSGAPTHEDLLVARYTTSGALDTSFGTNGSTLTDLGSEFPTGANSADLGLALALQPDDKILVGGSTDYPPGNGDLNFFVARYDTFNTAPTVTDVTKTGTEGQPVSFTTTDFSDQFSDPDGDILRKIQVLSLPVDGTLTLSAVPVSLNQEIPAHELGNLVFTPQADFSGTTSFIWNGSDGLYYAAAPANVNLTLAGVNDAPILDPIGNQSGNEQTLITFTASASDPDPTDILTYSLDPGAPAGASIDPTSGVFTWSPAESQGPGTVPLTVRVTDNGTPILSDFESITITVYEVNTAPVLDPIGDQIGAEGSLISFAASAIDSDLPANTLAYSLLPGAPAGASIDPANGLFTWTPSELQGPGIYTTTVQVSDNGSPVLSAQETITLTVAEVNTAPTLAAISDQVLAENNLLSVTAVATDTDLPANSLTFSLDPSAPAGAAIDPATGELSWTPGEDQGPGVYNFTVTVSDDGLPALNDQTSFQVTVQETNLAPILSPIGNQSATEDQLLTFTATASDADLPANALTFSLDPGAPAGAALDPASGLFTWTPSEDQGPGVYTVTLQVSDDGTPSLSAAETFSVTVDEANIAPTLDPLGNQVVAEGSLLSFTATASDSDLPANTLTFSLDPGAPAGAALDPASGLFTWTPAESQGPGVYTLTLRVTDDGTPSLSAAETFTVTVDEANNAPALDPLGNQVVAEGSLLSFTATASDSDLPANALTFSLDPGAPAGAVLDPASGLFTWTPSEDQGPGVYTITVSVSDDGVPLLSDQATFQVTVEEANQAPSLDPISDQVVNEDHLLSFSASASDGDLPANTLTYSLDPGAPAGASLDPTSGLFTWTPGEADSPGSIAITVRVSDNGNPNLADLETFTVTINEVNDAPSFTGGANVTVPENAGPQTINAWATEITPGEEDEATQSLVFNLETNNAALFATAPSIDPTNGNLAFTPAADISGAALITVTLQDDGGTANGGIDLSPPYNFTITIESGNHAPLVSDFTKLSWPNQVVRFTLSDFSTQFSDADSDLLVTIQITDLPDTGSLELAGVPVSAGQEISAQESIIQTLTFTPGLNWTGTTAFTWNGSDGVVYAEAPASVVITITNQGLLFLPLVLQAP